MGSPASYFSVMLIQREGVREYDKFVMSVLRNDVESKVNGTYFCSEDGAFHRKGFLVNGFIENRGTHCFIAILGAIHKYILIVRIRG